jgi:hypothetical protein
MTMIRSAPLDASELSLATVRDCTRAFVRSGIGVLIFPTWSVEVDNHFTWRGLTGLQLGILDVWAEAHRGWTIEDGPISTMGASIADAVDGALYVLDVAHRSLPKFPAPSLLVSRHVEVRSAIDVPTREIPDRRITWQDRHGPVYNGVKGSVTVPLIAEQGCIGICATTCTVVTMLAVRALCGEFLIRVQIAAPDLLERPREVQGNTFQLFAHLVLPLTLSTPRSKRATRASSNSWICLSVILIDVLTAELPEQRVHRPSSDSR